MNNFDFFNENVLKDLRMDLKTSTCWYFNWMGEIIQHFIDRKVFNGVCVH